MLFKIKSQIKKKKKKNVAFFILLIIPYKVKISKVDRDGQNRGGTYVGIENRKYYTCSDSTHMLTLHTC